MLRIATWLVCAALLLVASPAPAAPAFPIKVGPTGRYLVDQNGVPFLMTGESPQSMIGNLSVQEAELFFQNRRSHGFNTVLIDLLCASYTGCRADGTTFDGIAPFLGQVNGKPDLSTPNPAYFARADAILNLATQYGFLVMLDPAETGSWLAVMQANGVDKTRAFGRFVGQRYKSRPNLIWFHGNDYGPPHFDLSPENDALVTAVALGIKEFDTTHLHTVLFNTNTNLPPVLSTSNPRWLPIINLNAAYTYQATYVNVLQGYNYSPPMPVFMGETGYEFESIAVFGTDPRALRAQEYWTLLSGATGQLYGNAFIWPFTSGWPAQLDTPGAVQMAYLVALFEPRRWYDLVPDQSHALVTAGYESFGAADYVTAARTPDGTLAMAYVPSARTITVNLGTMSGLVTARWYDPANGTFTAVGGSPFSNTGPHDFTTPGDNSEGSGIGDWVLVLESQAVSAPVLSAISPTQVNVGGPDFTLTATGVNFDSSSVVRINGGERATAFVSSTKLTATVLGADIAVAGTASVTVLKPGAAPSAGRILSVRNPAPALSTIAPSHTLAGGPGLTLTVTGTGFVPSSVIRWNGASRPTSFGDTSTLSAQIPASDIAAAATASITVLTPAPGGGTTAAATFTSAVPGRVAFTSATAAVDETATSVTLTVTRTLGLGGPVTVAYATENGTARAGEDYDATAGTLTFAFGEATKTIVVPVHFVPGGSNETFTVTLSNPQSGLALGTPPLATVTIRNVVSTLASFTPAQGPVGTLVTVSGTNLQLASAVHFNGANASSVTLLGSTSLRAVVPAGATTGPIGLVGAGGNPVSAGVFKVTPKTTSLSPDSGMVSSTVTIAGTSFTGATQVRFGSIPAAAFNVADDRTVTAEVPPAAVTAPVSVTTPGGTAVSPAPFLVIRPPTITSFTPALGPEGTAVTINGANLMSVTGLSFNGVEASSVTIVSAASIRALVPAGATTGRLVAVNPAGQATSLADFKAAPRIASVTPAAGTAGTEVTLTGTTFTGATAVRFAGVAAVVTMNSSTQIAATVPVTAPSGRITVTTPSGSGTSPADFTVIRPPTLTSFTPASGPVRTEVTISGANLGTVSALSFAGVNASSVTVLSPTSLRAVVPAGATSGKIGAVNPVAATQSAASFVVAPSIAGCVPDRGMIGTSVVISGATLTGATAVRFGGMAATFTVNGPTQITAMVPPTAVSGPISVTTPGGSVTGVGAFTVVRIPTITSFTPARAPVGAAVTLSGANLGSVSRVDFNGLNASLLTVLSPASVRVTVPDGVAVGRIHATNEAGTATSALDFVPAPLIQTVAPARALPGSPVTLTGRNFTGATGVRFGAVTASFSGDDTEITATVPATAVNGRVSVTTPAGTTTSAADFVVIRLPTITSVSPAQGPEGTLVMLGGANLAGVSLVAFGGVDAAAVTVLSPSSIRVSVPAGAVTGKVSAASEAGNASSVATFTVAPKILQTPAPALPGANVVLQGTSFTGASVVRFGATTAVFTVNGPTQITATVPSTATTGRISVTTPGGTATTPTDFTVIREPIVTAFTPGRGQVGAMVDVSGAGVGTASDVAFGGVSVSGITVLSPTAVRVAVPPGAVTGRIKVTNPAGDAQSAASFVLVPRLTGFGAPGGPAASAVTLLGSSFSGTTVVKFGAVSAIFTLDSDSQITAIVPATAVTGRVSVTTPGGTATSPTDYVVTAP